MWSALSTHRSRRSQSRTSYTVAGGVAAALALGIGGALGLRYLIRSRRRFDVRGRVVLITGASRGLGLELARQLASRGARLALCDRHEAELRRAREELENAGARSLFTATCDITDRREVQAFVEQVRAELGPVDVLINNAGIITVGPFETLDRANFQQSFATHVSGPLEFIKAVFPEMKQRRAGRIVNIGSIGGIVPVPHMAAYVASKHALVGLSKTLRSELALHDIYVTTVCPGTIRTGSPYHARFKGHPEKEYAWFATAANLPLLTIATTRLARRIVSALIHGDAMVITPLPARLGAILHGMLPGITTDMGAIDAALLQTWTGEGGQHELVEGIEADTGQLPGPLEAEQQRNAERFNQV